MANKSPTGVEILKGKTPQWRIGAKIGDGACAAVYELETIDGSKTGYAAKVAPLTVKKTTKGNSPIEVNDRLLNHEAVTYQNQFPDVQGKFIPHLPPGSGPPAHGTIDGFRFLIMERMDVPLYDVVPQLLSSTKKSDKFIDLGPICVQLLRCIEAIQTRRHVVVDVKPENFMLTFPSSKAPKKGTSVAQSLASRVRLLDLAMVQLWVSAYSSHRTNESTSGVVGTPLFASLNVHRGETPSRRDDLEALGYVILDLIIKLTSNDMSKELPWSKGKSDDEIAKLKADVIDDKNHSLWKNDLGGANVVDTFFSYMDTVRLYTYKKVPDYDELADVLGQLQVPISAKSAVSRKAAATTKKRTTSRSAAGTADVVATGNKRVTRSRAVDEAENPTPRKVPRDETFMEVEYPESFMEPTGGPQIDNESDDDSFGTAKMSLDGENEDPAARAPVAVEKGLTLTVTSGPHTGVSVDLLKGVCETLVVGRNPQTTAKALGFALPQDASLADSHVRLELSIRGKLKAVVVKDLKAAGGTFIGSTQIPSGKDSKAMRGQTIKIGQTGLVVGSLQPKEKPQSDIPNVKVVETQESAPSKSTRRTRGAKTAEVEPVPEVAQAAARETRLQRRGLAVFVKAGPHQGETYELEAGQVEALNIGANPSGTNGMMVALSKDKSLKATHLRMELMMMKQNKLKAIDVIDKSKGDTKVNRIAISNKSRVFASDEIKIGDSVLVIKQLE